MRSCGNTSTRSADRGKEVADPEDLADLADLVERPDPEDLADPAELPDPEGAAASVDPEDAADPMDLADPVDLADSADLVGLARADPRPMKSCVTTLAIVTTRSSSASATRPTILVSKGRI